MRTRWTGLFAIGACAALTVGAQAAENGLLGVKLFDSGLKVVSMYGSPDSIEAVNIGSMGGGGGGGAAGGRSGSMRGGPGGGAMGPGGPGGRGGPPAFSFGDFLLRQGGAAAGMSGDTGAGAPVGTDEGGGGGNAPARGGAGLPPSMGGRGGGGAPGGQATENTAYTRWIYNRAGSKYGFVVDKSGHVVQIEAIGLKNTKVKTSKGVTFGDSFATVIKKYQTPDGYDISGDNILARFLNKNRVAFRFARLGENKPQVVTGIVVAAGKG